VFDPPSDRWRVINYNIMQKKKTTMQRVRQWVDGTNSVLARPMIHVSGTYRHIDGNRLVAVTFDMGVVLAGLIDVMCNHTSTALYGITKQDGKVCLLLQDLTT